MLPLAFTALALFQGAAPQTAPPPKPAPDAVLATVDGAPITAAELEPYLWAWKSREALNELVSHKMVAAEATRRGVVAMDAEVKAKVDAQLAAMKENLPPGGTAEGAIQAQYGSMGRFALIVRTSLLVDKLAEADFKPERYVKVATILFPTAGDTTDVLGKAIKAADAAYAGLAAGKPWADVLKANEKNPTVVANGGLVGWKEVGVFPQSVQAQLADAKPLGFTKPVQTAGGIQIFRLLARGTGTKPEELTELKAQYLRGARQTVIAGLRQRTKVEIKG